MHRNPADWPAYNPVLPCLGNQPSLLSPHTKVNFTGVFLPVVPRYLSTLDLAKLFRHQPTNSRPIWSEPRSSALVHSTLLRQIQAAVDIEDMAGDVARFVAC